MANEAHPTQRAYTVGGVAIPIVGWALTKLGLTIPVWLAWPAAFLAILMLAYSVIGFAKNGWVWARGRGFKMLPLVVVVVSTLMLIGGLVWLALDRNIIALDDFKKETTELSGLSNSQLRVRVFDSVRQLRAKQNEYSQGLSELLQPQYSRNLTDEQKSERFWQQNALIAKFSNDFTLRINQDVRPDLITLRQELRIRLKALSLYDSDARFYNNKIIAQIKDPVLDYRMVAGASPLADLADLLENMAKELP